MGVYTSSTVTSAAESSPANREEEQNGSHRGRFLEYSF